MKLILTQEVAGLGARRRHRRGQDGYGRNFLVPRGAAIAVDQGRREADRADQAGARRPRDPRPGPRPRDQGRAGEAHRHARRPRRRGRPAVRLGHRGRRRRGGQGRRRPAAGQEADRAARPHQDDRLARRHRRAAPRRRRLGPGDRHRCLSRDSSLSGARPSRTVDRRRLARRCRASHATSVGESRNRHSPADYLYSSTASGQPSPRILGHSGRAQADIHTRRPPAVYKRRRRFPQGCPQVRAQAALPSRAGAAIACPRSAPRRHHVPHRICRTRPVAPLRVGVTATVIPWQDDPGRRVRDARRRHASVTAGGRVRPHAAAGHRGRAVRARRR